MPPPIRVPPEMTLEARFDEFFCPISSLTIYTIKPYPRFGPPSHTVILLHGRHGDGEALREDLLVSERDSEGHSLAEIFPSVQWVFPSSPDGYCTKQNIVTQQWFDIWDLKKPWLRGNLQFPGLMASESGLRRLIDREAMVVNGYENVLIGGMSQGSALALALFLSSKRRLGGFMGMCGWMPLLDCSKGGHKISKPHPNIRASPMFFTHSIGDEHVPIRNFQVMVDLLLDIGMNVCAHENMDEDRVGQVDGNEDEHEDREEQEAEPWEVNEVPHWIAGSDAVKSMGWFLRNRVRIMPAL